MLRIDNALYGLRVVRRYTVNVLVVFTLFKSCYGVNANDVWIEGVESNGIK